MKQMGLKAKIRAKKAYRHPAMGEISEHLLKRRFTAKKPNEKWLTGEGTMLHSDQGVLYRTAEYRKLIAKHYMVQSMSRKANCWDNAPMESFFAVLKTECFYNAGELTVDELMKQIDDYMDYYNRERCSLKLKKLSPVAYRTQLAQSA